MSNEHVVIPVSIGEVFDKITILEIKLEHARSPSTRRNVELEYRLLIETLGHAALSIEGRFEKEVNDLRKVNQRLWTVEDDIRDLERLNNFGVEFIELARSVYVLNDERAAIKRRINLAAGSTIVEEKLYSEYKPELGGKAPCDGGCAAQPAAPPAG